MGTTRQIKQQQQVNSVKHEERGNEGAVGVVGICYIINLPKSTSKQKNNKRFKNDLDPRNASLRSYLHLCHSSRTYYMHKLPLPQQERTH